MVSEEEGFNGMQKNTPAGFNTNRGNACNYVKKFTRIQYKEL